MGRDALLLSWRTVVGGYVVGARIAEQKGRGGGGEKGKEEELCEMGLFET